MCKQHEMVIVTVKDDNGTPVIESPCKSWPEAVAKARLYSENINPENVTFHVEQVH